MAALTIHMLYTLWFWLTKMCVLFFSPLFSVITFNFFNNKRKEPGVVVHAFNTSTQEAEADNSVEFKSAGPS